MSNRIEAAETLYGEFLRHANLCDALAVDLIEPVNKAALLEMAQRWRELACAERATAAGITRRGASNSSQQAHR
jgi:hypothetical protein